MSTPVFRGDYPGILDKGEPWPEFERKLNFRLTTRDNRGGVTSDEMSVSVIESVSFSIIPPLGNNIVSGVSNMLTWTVGDTNYPLINCDMVDISLSTDEGISWKALAQKTPNKGMANVYIPVVMEDVARIKLSCSDNIFFVISPALTISRYDLPTTEESSVTVKGAEQANNTGGGGTLDLNIFILLFLSIILRRRII